MARGPGPAMTMAMMRFGYAATQRIMVNYTSGPEMLELKVRMPRFSWIDRRSTNHPRWFRETKSCDENRTLLSQPRLACGRRVEFIWSIRSICVEQREENKRRLQVMVHVVRQEQNRRNQTKCGCGTSRCVSGRRSDVRGR